MGGRTKLQTPEKLRDDAYEKLMGGQEQDKCVVDGILCSTDSLAFLSRKLAQMGDAREEEKVYSLTSRSSSFAKQLVWHLDSEEKDVWVGAQKAFTAYVRDACSDDEKFDQVMDAVKYEMKPIRHERAVNAVEQALKKYDIPTERQESLRSLILNPIEIPKDRYEGVKAA